MNKGLFGIAAIILALAIAMNTSVRITTGKRTYKNAVISGTDTIIVDANGNIDVTKARFTRGHNDTAGHVFYTEFIRTDTTRSNAFIDPSAVVLLVKPYLIQYYKAGWMDASNGCIDLTNKGRFDNGNVLKLQNKHWRKIEAEVNSK